MKAAKEFFKEQLGSLSTDRLKKITEALSSRLQFIVIEIANDEDAISLFQVLNDRGVRLSYGDLVKSKVLSKINTNFKRELEEYYDRWDEIMENLGDADTGKFVRHYIIANEDYQNNTLQKISRELDTKLKNKNYAKELTDNLLQFSEHYETIIQSKGEFSEQFREIAELGAERCYPLMMATLAQDLDSKEKRKIIEKTIALTFRYSTIMNKDAKDLEATYASCCRILRKESDVGQVLRQLNDKMPKHNEFRLAFIQKDSYKHSIARYVLGKIEQEITKELKVRGVEYNELEHIFPLNDALWVMGEEEKKNMREIRETLGNLLILKKKSNRGIKNKSFEEKKKAYNQSGLRLPLEVAKEGKWTSEDIKKRTEKLFEIAQNVWK